MVSSQFLIEIYICFMPQGHISIHRETNLQLSSMRVLAIGKKQTNKQTNFTHTTNILEHEYKIY
jgi:hypothetical protein